MILLSKKKPEKSLIDVLKEAHALYDRKISRGSQFKFMWMDAERESAWTEMLFPGDFPAVVVLNPGKRKRFLVHEGPISTNSISFIYFIKIYIDFYFIEFFFIILSFG